MNPDDVNPPAPVVEPTPPVVEPPAPKPGEKTDPALLLKSLQEERDLRRKRELEIEGMEKELSDLRSASGNAGEPLSEEGTLLKKQIDELSSKLEKGENEKRLTALETSHPVLKEKATEFDTYRADPANKGMTLETAAKAFLAENDLLTITPRRKGLEEGGGGAQTPPKQGLSPEEVDDLRKTNYREYARRIRSGEI